MMATTIHEGHGCSHPESVQEMYINKMAAQLRTLRRNLEKRAQVQGGQATQAGDPPAGVPSQSQGSADAAAQAAQGLPHVSGNWNRVPEAALKLNKKRKIEIARCCSPGSSRLLPHLSIVPDGIGASLNIHDRM